MPQSNETLRLKRKINKLLGLCTCCGKNQNMPGATKCVECSNADKHRARIRYIKNIKIWKKKKLCHKCGKTPMVGRKYCANCAKESSDCFKRIRDKNKILIQQHYGGKCKKCGEANPDLLCIDHINNDGNKHRKEIGNSNNLYKSVIKDNFPACYRLLCWNCNHIAYLESRTLSTSHRAIILRNHYMRTKIKTFNLYGGCKCKHCGNIDLRVLCLDHINGGGMKHRNDLADSSSYGVYKWACEYINKEMFQVLCMNCNTIKKITECNYASCA